MSSNHEIGGSKKIRVVNKISRGGGEGKVYLVENPCFTYELCCFHTSIAFFTEIHRELFPD